MWCCDTLACAPLLFLLFIGTQPKWAFRLILQPYLAGCKYSTHRRVRPFFWICCWGAASGVFAYRNKKRAHYAFKRYFALNNNYWFQFFKAWLIVIWGLRVVASCNTMDFEKWALLKFSWIIAITNNELFWYNFAIIFDQKAKKHALITCIHMGKFLPEHSKWIFSILIPAYVHLWR